MNLPNDIDQSFMIRNELKFIESFSHKFVLDDKTVDNFRIYLEELISWNSKINLIASSDPLQIISRHFADSLHSLFFIENDTARFIDIGTGAGFPGIAVKLILNNSHITLVESITKKCVFLEHIIKTLKLDNIDIVNDRAENIAQKDLYREKYDIGLSRALCKLSPNLEVLVPFVKTGGKALIFKTEESAFGSEGLPAVKNAMDKLHIEPGNAYKYSLAGSDKKYCIIPFIKTVKTPLIYPRKPGIPEKKPL